MSDGRFKARPVVQGDAKRSRHRLRRNLRLHQYVGSSISTIGSSIRSVAKPSFSRIRLKTRFRQGGSWITAPKEDRKMYGRED